MKRTNSDHRRDIRKVDDALLRCMELRLDAGVCGRRSMLRLLCQLEVRPEVFAAHLADFTAAMQNMDAGEDAKRAAAILKALELSHRAPAMRVA